MSFDRETWQVALRALSANWFRVFLAMLGVMIGSASMVLVVTVGLTGKRYITQQIEAVGSNVIHAELVRGATTPVTDLISVADMQAIRESIPEVIEVAGTRSLSMSVTIEGKERPVAVVGVTEGFQPIRNLEVVRGRFLDPDDMRLRSKVGVITEELAQARFPSTDPLGKTLRLGELQFTIVGVFRERISTFGTSEIKTETVLIPFPLLRYYTENAAINNLYVQAATPDDVPPVTRKVQEVLRGRHRAGATYLVQNLAGLLQTAQSVSLALTIVLFLLGLIALSISGIGIMNIMLVSVTERTYEIGLRKAIGAPPRAVLHQFLLEAFLISVGGALAGLLAALSIPELVRPLLPAHLSPPVSWLSVALGFLVSSSVGIFFGYLPAKRAARLHPADALRHE